MNAPTDLAHDAIVGRRWIVMVATARDGAGGIASVIATYAADGLFLRWPIMTLDSHVTGAQWRKLAAFLSALARFTALLLGRRVGLLHVHASSGPSFWRKTCFALLALMFRRPVLLHIHSGEFMAFYTARCGPIRQRVVRYVFEHSTRVIALSASWRDRILSIAPRANVVCIPNPVIVAEGKPRQLRQRIVLFLGKICDEKGVFDLIEAWRQVQSHFDGARLILAGNGEIERARAHINRLRLTDSIELPGWVSGEQKNALLAKADVCVLPSYFEGMPMSILEAFGSGLPCVATTVGGIPDMMSNGIEGRLIRPGDIQALADALVDVLADEARYAAMSQAALARFVSHYAAAVVIPKLENLYSSLGMTPKQT